MFEALTTENTFEHSILHRESRNGNVGEAWIVESVHKEAVRETRGVNNSRFGISTDDGKWNTNGDVLFVSTGGNLNTVVGRHMSDGRLYF